ncbi:MAG: hypothetical protein SPI25_05010 [Dialister sp.]|nr:hypothetical protein [Dialister sp.]
MDSDTLMRLPIRYRIIDSGKASVPCADMDTIMSAETVDYPSSLQNIHCPLYRMDHASNPSDMVLRIQRLVPWR